MSANTNPFETAEAFENYLDTMHLKSKGQINSALRMMTESQRQVVRFHKQQNETEWNDYQEELIEQGF